MSSLKRKIGKREFIQYTSKYLHWVEDHGTPLIITHQNSPALIISKVKTQTLKDLRGSVNIKIKEDINEPVLPGYDKW